MTDQIHDGLVVDEQGYYLLDASPGLFSPYQYGIEPDVVSTANWCGYQAGFAVRDQRLYLAYLSVGWIPPRPKSQSTCQQNPLDEWCVDKTLPELHGVSPTPAGESYMLYDKVNMPLLYTGTLTASRRHPIPGAPLECAEFVFEKGGLRATLATHIAEYW